MKTEKKDLILYGEWDNDIYEYPEDTVWFEKSSCQYFHTYTLIEEYGYDSYEDISSSNFFIPVFCRDIIELMKSFVKSRNDSEIEKSIQRIIETERESYGIAFRIYSEVHPLFEEAWNEYENSILESDAKEWAKRYGVEFFGDYDPERRIVFSVLAMYFHYEEKSVPKFTRYWLSKKDYSIANIVDKENILSSGLCSAEKFEKEYVSIPAVTESDAKEAGKSLNQYVEEIAKKWCENNSIKWFNPTGVPDHPKQLSL